MCRKRGGEQPRRPGRSAAMLRSMGLAATMVGTMAIAQGRAPLIRQLKPGDARLSNCREARTTTRWGWGQSRAVWRLPPRSSVPLDPAPRRAGACRRQLLPGPVLSAVGHEAKLGLAASSAVVGSSRSTFSATVGLTAAMDRVRVPVIWVGVATRP